MDNTEPLRNPYRQPRATQQRTADSIAPHATAPTVPPRNPYSQTVAGPVALQEREKEEGGQLMKSVRGGTGVCVPTFSLGDDDEEDAVLFRSRPSGSSPSSARPSSAPPIIQGTAPSLSTRAGATNATATQALPTVLEEEAEVDDFDIGGIEDEEENRKPKAAYSVVAKTLRKIAGSFPRVDVKGVVYQIKAGKVGSASRMDRTDLTEDDILRQYPSNPLVQLPNSAIRASSCKKGNKHWNEATMKEAVDELLIPDDFRYIIVSPEVFDRIELAKHSEFVKTNEQGLVTGVMAPCIYCHSNKFVSHSEFNVQKYSSQRPRVTFGADGKMMAMVAPIFKCTNPACVGKEPEPGKDARWVRDLEKKKTHTFSIWTKEAFSQ